MLLAAVLAVGPWSCQEERPWTRQVLLAHDAADPEARWMVSQFPSGRSNFVALSREAEQRGRPPIWKTRIDPSAGSVWVDGFHEPVELVIDEVQPPRQASAADVAAIERVVGAVGSLATWDEDPLIRRIHDDTEVCSYGGDQVQRMLDAGVELRDLVPVLIRQWTRVSKEQRIGALGFRVLRSTATHRDAIRGQLQQMASDPELDLDSRLMATNAWWYMRPELSDRSQTFDPGDPTLRAYLALQADGHLSRCDRDYEASAPWGRSGDEIPATP